MTTSVPDLGRNELYEEAIPYELFARLRQESPLWIEEPAAPGFKGGPGYWAVLRHADVQIVSRHPEIYSSWLGGTELRERPPQVLEILRQQMLNTDPPQHSKMRRIVSRAFTPQVISQLRASIEALEVLVEVPHGGTAVRRVRADAFEDAAAVVQRVREYVDLGVRPRDELAVHPDRLALRDRHQRLLPSARRGRCAGVQGYREAPQPVTS